MKQVHCQLPALAIPSDAVLNLRSSSSKGEKDPRQEELRVDIGRLDEQEQGEANDGIADHSNEPNAQTVRYQAPEGTCDQGHDLINEAQSANDITDAILDVQQVSEHKRNAAVEEDEERDGEERDTK